MRFRLIYLFIGACIFSSCGGKDAATDSTAQSTATPAGDAATQKISKALSLTTLEDMSEEDAGKWKPCEDCQGLTSQTFDTVYDANSIICIKRTAEYMAAYPSTGVTYFNFDKRTGDKVTAKDVFTAEKMNNLVKECNDRIDIIVTSGRKGVGADDMESYNSTMETMTPFTIENLDHFYVTNEGVVFNYQFGFPHAIQALEPSGDLSFSIAQLKSSLKPDGLLGAWVK